MKGLSRKRKQLCQEQGATEQKDDYWVELAEKSQPGGEELMHVSEAGWPLGRESWLTSEQRVLQVM